MIPDRIDQFTGYRYYSAEKLLTCNRIIAMKEMGFSLQEIRSHLQTDQAEDFIALLDRKCTELEAAEQNIVLQLKRLNQAKKSIARGEGTMFDIIVTENDVFCYSCERRVFQKKEDAYLRLLEIKKELPSQIIGNRMIIRNHETEYKSEKLDLTVGVEITGELPKNSRYSVDTIVSQDCAKLICKKAELSQAYCSLIEQMHLLNYQVTGSFTEIYYEDNTVELRVPVIRLHDKTEENSMNEKTTSKEFCNDSEAIGKWKFVDKVISCEQFSPKSKKCSEQDNIWLKEIFFLPDGAGYWIIKSWTKGEIHMTFGYPKHNFCQKYHIEKREGKTYLFVEMNMDYALFEKGGKPEIYVYEKVDSTAYDKKMIQKKDKTDMPFISDAEVFGKWNTVDYVREIDMFVPGKQSCPVGALYVKSIEFTEDGKAFSQYGTEPLYNQTWTKGYVIDVPRSVTEAYFIKEIEGKKYLFVEWKTGDYLFGNRKPDYYVYQK